MRTTLKGLLAAAVLATGGLAVTAPAQAQGYYGGGYYDRGYGYGDDRPRYDAGYYRDYRRDRDWERHRWHEERRWERDRWEHRGWRDR